jgi:hypothetical protein
MINAYSICNPSMIKKIYEAYKKSKEQGYPAFVFNSKGNIIMNVMAEPEDIWFRDCGKDIGNIVRKALNLFTKNTGLYHWNLVE